jgi:antitoxin component YwqK of YwqJK toxin-antitoxin module|tara:strand:+ start:148 stop:984 length:837 start_codon:yes stop_codon:yes gene_type:complete
MKAYVSKDGKQYGPYPVEQLRKYVQEGNFTAEDLACHDGQNWVKVAEVPGFATGDDTPTTPEQDQAVQEKAIDQKPESADASNPASKKKKIILWSSIGGIAALLVTNFVIWLRGGDEDSSPESNPSSAEPPDAKIDQVSKIDLDDPKTRKKIVAKAVKGKKLQFRGKTGEELAYAPNQQKPYTGWKKWIHDNGRLVGLSQFKNGKLDGLRTWWYPNGRKKAERTYKDGKLWTAVRWKPNGEKCPVTNLVNGSGVVVQLHSKGPVHLSTTFKDGKIVKD